MFSFFARFVPVFFPHKYKLIVNFNESHALWRIPRIVRAASHVGLAAVAVAVAIGAGEWIRVRMRKRIRIKQFRFCLAAAVNVTGFGTPPSPFCFSWGLFRPCVHANSRICAYLTYRFIRVYRYVCVFVCLHGYYVFRCLFISFNEMCKQLQKLAVVEQRTAKKNVAHAFLFLFQYPVNVECALKGYN